MGESRRFRSASRWTFRPGLVLAALWPGLVSLSLLVFTTYLQRLDVRRERDRAPDWMWELGGGPTLFAALLCLLGVFWAGYRSDERHTCLTVIVNVPPILVLLAQYAISW